MSKTKIIRSIEDFTFNSVDMVVEGYALKFDSPTTIFENSPFQYTEVIDRNALKHCDFSKTVFNKNHNNSDVYARTENNSLELTVDDIGLKIKANILDTQAGTDLFKEIKSKLINKMSFAFPVFDSEIIDKEGIVTIKSIGKLIDVSAVTFPAYDDTSITARASDYLVKKDNKITGNTPVQKSKKIETKGENIMNLIDLNKVTTATQCNRALEQINNSIKDLTVLRGEIRDEIKSDDVTVEEIDAKKAEIETMRIEEAEMKEQRAIIEQRLANINAQRSTPDIMEEKNSYLSTEQSVADFGETLIRSNGKQDFMDKWGANLTKRGISNPEAFVPEPIVSAITDCFEQNGDILSMVTKMTTKEWKVLLETGGEVALGHQAGNVKVAQTLTFDPLKIFSAYVAKYQVINRIDEQDGGKVLIDFLLKELPQRLVYSLERAILVGDGLAPTSKDKITEVKPIIEADSTYVTEITTDLSLDTIDELWSAIDTTNDSMLAMVMSKQSYTLARNQRSADGKRIFEFGTVTKNGRNYKTIDGHQVIFRKYMDTDVDRTIIMADFSGYTFISMTQNPEFYKDMVIDRNQSQYLIELRCGGNVTKCKSASYVKKLLA
jgi:HK97 family phage prohead protease